MLPADLPVRRPDVARELEGVVLAEQEPPALPGQLALRPLPLGGLAAEPGDIPPPQPARLVYDGREPIYLSQLQLVFREEQDVLQDLLPALVLRHQEAVLDGGLGI